MQKIAEILKMCIKSNLLTQKNLSVTLTSFVVDFKSERLFHQMIHAYVLCMCGLSAFVEFMPDSEIFFLLRICVTILKPLKITIKITITIITILF